MSTVDSDEDTVAVPPLGELELHAVALLQDMPEVRPCGVCGLDPEDRLTSSLDHPGQDVEHAWQRGPTFWRISNSVDQTCSVQRVSRPL